jgi:hypothetical protein
MTHLIKNLRKEGADIKTIKRELLALQMVWTRRGMFAFGEFPMCWEAGSSVLTRSQLVFLRFLLGLPSSSWDNRLSTELFDERSRLARFLFSLTLF